MNTLGDFLKHTDEEAHQAVKHDQDMIEITSLQSNLKKAYRNTVKARNKLKRIKKDFHQKKMPYKEYRGKKNAGETRLIIQEKSVARMIAKLHNLKPELAKAVKL